MSAPEESFFIYLLGLLGKRPLSTALTSVSVANVGPVTTRRRVSQRLVHNEGVHDVVGWVSKGSRQATDDLKAE
jgi:hypothetical protein